MYERLALDAAGEAIALRALLASRDADVRAYRVLAQLALDALAELTQARRRDRERYLRALRAERSLRPRPMRRAA